MNRLDAESRHKKAEIQCKERSSGKHSENTASRHDTLILPCQIECKLNDVKLKAKQTIGFPRNRKDKCLLSKQTKQNHTD